MNSTFQDRLVKELRLAGISDVPAADAFLRDVFLPAFAGKFGRVPREPGDAHLPLSEAERAGLDATFSTSEPRKIQNDFTVRFRNRFLQLYRTPGNTFFRGDSVEVETWFDGAVRVARKGSYLDFKELPERPGRIGANALPLPPGNPADRTFLFA